MVVAVVRVVDLDGDGDGDGDVNLHVLSTTAGVRSRAPRSRNPAPATGPYTSGAARRVRWELPDDGIVELISGFVPDERCAATFESLRAALPFEAKEIVIFGKPVMQPRLTAWVGDAGAVYRYSGTRNEPHPWPEALSELRARVIDAAGVPFNSVLCNLYRSGSDSMGMHSDSEPELGRDPVIASLSLGAVRRFQLRHRKHKGVGLDVDLPDGSLLLMRGALQHHYRHGVPKQPSVIGERINLTFRVVTARDAL